MTNLKNLRWQFDELLKTLIAMSLPYEKQRHVYGLGATADEMLEDFHSYYTLKKNEYVKAKLIDQKSTLALDNIEKLTGTWIDEKEEDFWYEMDEHELSWNMLREIARVALRTLKKEHLQIDVRHENKLDGEGNILVQKTYVELKHDKNNL